MANERDTREEFQSVNDFRNTLAYQFKKAGLLGSSSKAPGRDSVIQVDGATEVDGALWVDRARQVDFAAED
ncbi:uncharacterized protein FTOL_10803 [Fusarium torulosum]|uniref:Uncharacterized protein n=1 Tax=Fusarium torulosum TaxID=33205 RepID=A0AAE8MHB7_9HYPO|nr:uncharacterized protein FTOL_10803 [Fusarium torulosum]